MKKHTILWNIEAWRQESESLSTIEDRYDLLLKILNGIVDYIGDPDIRDAIDGILM